MRIDSPSYLKSSRPALVCFASALSGPAACSFVSLPVIVTDAASNAIPCTAVIAAHLTLRLTPLAGAGAAAPDGRRYGLVECAGTEFRTAVVPGYAGTYMVELWYGTEAAPNATLTVVEGLIARGEG